MTDRFIHPPEPPPGRTYTFVRWEGEDRNDPPPPETVHTGIRAAGCTCEFVRIAEAYDLDGRPAGGFVVEHDETCPLILEVEFSDSPVAVVVTEL